MRSVFLICYDIADPKRLRKVYQTMLGVGEPLQYSVFRCELSRVERQLLKEKLWDLIDLSADRIMLVDMGPAGSRGDDCVEFWGEPRTAIPEQRAVIV